ncbi:MAG: D-alanyl-D-alanine carboxypeptidase/D-alanyl-D-alanine-endopeptidase [Propionibacteriaceae bacterium]|jgi:D-alanyl-D-alanine carboxypeptidase/D-alanyl-D-alanine-endopeptidase (penicillin-binding protein 4)|nr:D-alanyl-D-alanine carboxypeptidase/D-alanyl-D-alanine-endopeptidase [Propionibacteriaceae bacterium]
MKRLTSICAALALTVGLLTGVQPLTQAEEEPAPAAILPDSDILSAKLAKISTKYLPKTSVAVLTTDGETVVNRNEQALIPASTLKIFTALAAIDVLGEDTRFTTSVVQESKSKIILVGGGDPQLRRTKSTTKAKAAWLSTLASRTATALKKAGIKKVALGYDASLFSGPGWSPSWGKEWHPDTPPVSALIDNGGMISSSKASDYPAKRAANHFAALLKKKGIKVTSVKSAAAGDAPVIAKVDSARLYELVKYMLRYSHNLTAEALVRHLGIAYYGAGHGSFTDGTAALQEWMVAHGLWKDGMVLDSGSGMSNKNRIYPEILAKAVNLALADTQYTAVRDGLPVAGVSGTLKKRFNDSSEKIGRKNVHAKTGTLRSAVTLAGWLTTKDGTVLTFAAMANDVNKHYTAGGNWVDRTAATIVGCGCR